MEGCLPHRGTVGSKGCSLSQEQEGESHDLGRVWSLFLPSLGPAAPGSGAGATRSQGSACLNKRSAFDPRPPRVYSPQTGSCASAQNVLRCPRDPTPLSARPSHRGQQGPGGGQGCRVAAGGGLGGGSGRSWMVLEGCTKAPCQGRGLRAPECGRAGAPHGHWCRSPGWHQRGSGLGAAGRTLHGGGEPRH